MAEVELQIAFAAVIMSLGAVLAEPKPSFYLPGAGRKWRMK